MEKAMENEARKTKEDESGLTPKPLFLDIDEMLQLVGDYHFFQKIIMVIFFFTTIPAFFQLFLTYFATISPRWRCDQSSAVCTTPSNITFPVTNTSRCRMQRSDWQYIEPKDFSIVTEFDLVCEREFLVELVTSILFLGFMFGAMILGPCADNFGRKLVLYVSLTVVILLSSVSVFTGNIYAFITTRFIVGFFLHGTFPQVILLVSELVGNTHRALCLSIVTTIAAGLSMPFLALLGSLIPKWKVLFLLCTAPYSCLLLCAKFVPESVRYLRVKGDTEKAMRVFNRIAYWNKTHLPPNVRIAPAHSNTNSNNNDNDQNKRKSVSDGNIDAIKNDKKMETVRKAGPLDLFRTVRLATTTLIIGFSSLTISMTNYCLSLESGNLTGHIYRDFAILNLSRMPAGIFIPFVLNCLGRKKAVMTFGLIGGISCLVLGFTPESDSYKTLRLICGIVGIMSMSSGGIAYRTWALELFPTDIRGAGMGFSQFTNKLGATSSAWVVTDLSKLYGGAPNFLIGCMGLTAFILQAVLRETKGVKTADTGEELEEICNKEDEQGLDELVVAYVNPLLVDDEQTDGKISVMNPYKE